MGKTPSFRWAIFPADFGQKEVDIPMLATDLHDSDDEDWYAFEAVAGYHYTIDTFDLGASTDTEVSLFPPDLYADGFCTMPPDWPDSSWTCCGLSHDETWMLTDDDGGVEARASHIQFVAPFDGLYKVRVRPKDAAGTGAYGLSLARHVFDPEAPLLEFPGYSGI